MLKLFLCFPLLFFLIIRSNTRSNPLITVCNKYYNSNTDNSLHFSYLSFVESSLGLPTPQCHRDINNKKFCNILSLFLSSLPTLLLSQSFNPLFYLFCSLLFLLQCFSRQQSLSLPLNRDLSTGGASCRWTSMTLKATLPGNTVTLALHLRVVGRRSGPSPLGLQKAAGPRASSFLSKSVCYFRYLCDYRYGCL